MAYAAGVDVGSTQTKAVIIDEDRRIVARVLQSCPNVKPGWIVWVRIRKVPLDGR